jgi:hypothetical protein
VRSSGGVARGRRSTPGHHGRGEEETEESHDRRFFLRKHLLYY